MQSLGFRSSLSVGKGEHDNGHSKLKAGGFGLLPVQVELDLVPQGRADLVPWGR